MPSRLQPVFARLERALQEVHDGSLDPRRATAMASLAGGMVKVFQAGQEPGGGDFTQIIYPTVDEFYAEIREYQRRPPLLAGQKPALLESPEDKGKRLEEFMREHGTEKLPTEAL